MQPQHGLCLFIKISCHGQCVHEQFGCVGGKESDLSGPLHTQNHANTHVSRPLPTTASNRCQVSTILCTVPQPRHHTATHPHTSVLNQPTTTDQTTHLYVKQGVEGHILPKGVLDHGSQLFLVLQLDGPPLPLEGGILSIRPQLGQLIGVGDPAVGWVFSVFQTRGGGWVSV